MDYDLTLWALDHGATVQPKGETQYEDNDYFRYDTTLPILEQAVRYDCNVSTVDLLRSEGAPMTRRVLHFAAEKASTCPEALVKKRVALVRHLLDKYKLDVNALDGPGKMGNHWGTPLCYVAHAGFRDCKDVVELLLDRGADPDLCKDPPGWSSISLAEQFKNFRFLESVACWRKRQSISE